MALHVTVLPASFANGAEWLRKAPFALAAACWLALVAALFAFWLAEPSGRENFGADCESLGRGGERCTPAAPATGDEDARPARGGSFDFRR